MAKAALHQNITESVGKPLFLLTILQVICHAYSVELTQKPRNTAVLKGQLLASLVCRAINTGTREIFGWNEFITSPTGTAITIENKIVHPKGEAKFGIVNNYDLQVKNTEPSDSGMYQCKLTRARIQAFAYIVVMDTRPYCATDKVENTTAEGETVTLICQVKYFGGWGPQLQWKAPSGGIILSIDVSKGSTRKYVANLTASASFDGASFACGLSFPAPPGNLTPDADYDRRNPVYTSGCNVLLTVLYGARNVQVTGRKKKYELGDKIYCSASGRPAAAYKWIKINGDGSGFPVNGSVLTIKYNMGGHSVLYCIASNRVRGQEKYASSAMLIITVNIPRTPSAVPPTTQYIPTESTTGNSNDVPTDTSLTIPRAGVAIWIIITVGMTTATIILSFILWRRSRQFLPGQTSKYDDNSLGRATFPYENPEATSPPVTDNRTQGNDNRVFGLPSSSRAAPTNHQNDVQYYDINVYQNEITAKAGNNTDELYEVLDPNTGDHLPPPSHAVYEQ